MSLKKPRYIGQKKAVEPLYMPHSRGKMQIEGDENIARNPISKDVLFLGWVLFVLFHRPVIEVIGTLLGFLVGADGVFPLVPGVGYKSVMD